MMKLMNGAAVLTDAIMINDFNGNTKSLTSAFSGTLYPRILTAHPPIRFGTSTKDTKKYRRP